MKDETTADIESSLAKLREVSRAVDSHVTESQRTKNIASEIFREMTSKLTEMSSEIKVDKCSVSVSNGSYAVEHLPSKDRKTEMAAGIRINTSDPMRPLLSLSIAARFHSEDRVSFAAAIYIVAGNNNELVWKFNTEPVSVNSAVAVKRSQETLAELKNNQQIGFEKFVSSLL